MATWGIAALKARASEFVETAQSKGPQEITRNGKLVGILVSPEEWMRKTQPQPLQNSRTMSEFFRNSPLVGSGIEIHRSTSKARKVEL